MASEFLQSVEIVLDDPCLQSSTPRIERMRELERRIIEAAKHAASATLCRDFFAEVIGILSNALEKGDRYQSMANKRGKIWAAFHQECITRLPSA